MGVEGAEKDERPRFFVELNEPFTVFGMNLNGFAPGLMLGAIFAGLELFTMAFLAVIPFVGLARRMAKEPDFLRGMGAKMRDSRAWLAARGGEPEPVVVVTPEGYRIKASQWGQWNAFRAANPGASLASVMCGRDDDHEAR
jgi:hypothetical protein